MWSPEQTVAIVNPAAGGGRVGRRWPTLQPQLLERLGPVRFCLTRAPGEATALAAEAVASGARTILSMGGDGTHNEVVNGILAANPEPGAISLGLLPAGTGGDLCRVVTTGTELLQAAAALPQSTGAPVDVGRVSFFAEDSGEARVRHFINTASLGISGVVDRIVSRSSSLLGGTATFYISTLRALAAYTPATVQLTLDGRDLGSPTITNVVICNSRYAGGGMLFGPEARLADGLLDVMIFEHRSVFASIALSSRIYAGTHAEVEHVTAHRGASLTVTPLGAAPLLLDTDGEVPGIGPATITVLPGAIRLLGVDPAVL
jgi:diacylglycerol kinase (ATP)